MNFRTEVEPVVSSARIDHNTPVLLLGSCFSEHIGRRMAEVLFPITINPFGILYNPISLTVAMQRLVEGRNYRPEELQEIGGLWHSFDHHGRFSALTKEACLEAIDQEFNQARGLLPQLKWLVLTLGSAWVYEWRDGGGVVANCHRAPGEWFRRRLLEVEEVVSHLRTALQAFRDLNADFRVIFTVSPVRHLHEGAHQNNLSKATLLLALERLVKENENFQYFPAYELALDDLRDYRFYAADLIHPAATMIDYIWEKFSHGYFTRETATTVAELQALNKARDHRPLFPASPGHQAFRKRELERIVRLEEEYPFLDLEEYRRHFQEETGSGPP